MKKISGRGAALAKRIVHTSAVGCFVWCLASSAWPVALRGQIRMDDGSVSGGDSESGVR